MRKLRRSSFLLLPALLLAAAIVGCGPRKPGIVAVSGVVTLDGKPVEKAAVMLVPLDSQTSQLPALAETDREGRFVLTTENVGQGAVPGEYQATVIKKETAGFVADKEGLSGGMDPGGIKERWIVPQKYASPNKSGLKIEIKPGMAPLKLDLKSQ